MDDILKLLAINPDDAKPTNIVLDDTEAQMMDLLAQSIANSAPFSLDCEEWPEDFQNMVRAPK